MTCASATERRLQNLAAFGPYLLRPCKGVEQGINTKLQCYPQGTYVVVDVPSAEFRRLLTVPDSVIRLW